MTLLAKRYADALHALAEEQGLTETLGAELQALHETLAAPGTRALLLSPDVTSAEREQLLRKLTAGRHQLLQNVVGVLEHRRRLAVMFELYPAWRTLVMAARGEVDGVAETPHPLPEQELAALEALAGRLSGKKVSLTVAVRPELLGGVRLRVGNVLYDGSLRAALDQLEARLSQAAIGSA
jgi:F-type H+-transporting ATPase subunit delta